MGLYNSSMQYTIGTALDHARERGHVVEILAEGQWLRGTVVASDGTGVLIANGVDDHAIIRLETIAAVRVRVASVAVVPSGADGLVDGLAEDAGTGGYSMPAPREPSW